MKTKFSLKLKTKFKPEEKASKNSKK